MITKAHYVSRLKKMLDTDAPCSTCPGFKGFWDYKQEQSPTIPDAKFLKGWVGSKYGFDKNICFNLCRDFIDLSTDQEMCYIRCPCHALGEKEALKRAIEAVAKYGRKTHKWNKKPTSRKGGDK